MIYPTNHEIKSVGTEGKTKQSSMSEKQLLAFQVHELLGPVVLFYAGSSSSIGTS